MKKKNKYIIYICVIMLLILNVVFASNTSSEGLTKLQDLINKAILTGKVILAIKYMITMFRELQDKGKQANIIEMGIEIFVCVVKILLSNVLIDKFSEFVIGAIFL